MLPLKCHAFILLSKCWEGAHEGEETQRLYTGSSSIDLYLKFVFVFLYLQIMLFSFVKGLRYTLLDFVLSVWDGEVKELEERLPFCQSSVICPGFKRCASVFNFLISDRSTLLIQEKYARMPWLSLALPLTFLCCNYHRQITLTFTNLIETTNFNVHMEYWCCLELMTNRADSLC